MELIERLVGAAAAKFRGVDTKLEWDDGLQKVTGFLIWDGFEEMDHVSRQQKVWEMVRGELGSEAVNVSLLLAYTPQEYETLMAA